MRWFLHWKNELRRTHRRRARFLALGVPYLEAENFRRRHDDVAHLMTLAAFQAPEISVRRKEQQSWRHRRCSEGRTSSRPNPSARAPLESWIRATFESPFALLQRSSVTSSASRYVFEQPAKVAVHNGQQRFS